MSTDRYDALVIGTGQAGPPLAARLCAAGMRTAIVERARFGGTCINTGCIPTKALVASAYVANKVRHAREYGIGVEGEVSVDWPAVRARKDRISGASRSGVEKWLRSLEKCTVLLGHARFTGPHAVDIGGQSIEAERIFINVGGRPSVPKMPGVDDTPFLTSDDVMDMDALPGHLIVVGGSYVGLEFGQVFRRLGSRVTIVEMGPRLIAREDPEVSEAVADILRGEDIALRLDATCITLAREGAGVRVGLDCKEEDKAVSGTHVLLAVGRAPNTDDLGLDAAGIDRDKRGYVKVDDGLETSVKGVYALGDCNGRGAFTHTSYNDYEIVAANLLDGAKRRVSDRITSYALYTDPPLGRVGMTETEAKKAGYEVLAATRPMTRVGRAVQKGETQGFMKATVDAKTKRILGAAILGMSGDEVVQSLIDAMYAGLTYEDVRRGVRIHPTVSELVPTLLEDLKPATDANVSRQGEAR